MDTKGYQSIHKMAHPIPSQVPKKLNLVQDTTPLPESTSQNQCKRITPTVPVLWKGGLVQIAMNVQSDVPVAGLDEQWVLFIVKGRLTMDQFENLVKFMNNLGNRIEVDFVDNVIGL